MKILESERLVYLTFSSDDYNLMLDLETNREAREFFGDIASPETVKNILNSFIKQYEKEAFSYFKVQLKETDEFIGAAGFERHKYTNEIGIGYILYKSYWNDQYPVEILTSLLAWGKKQIKTDYFISVIEKNDDPTKKALQDSGMYFYKEEKFDDLICNYYKFDNIRDSNLLGENNIAKLIMPND